MELNVKEALEQTVEYLNQTCYSLVRPEFTKYSGVYSFSTENLSYLEKINLEGKDVLTVTGSFDQAFNLVFEGARKICNFDTNVNTVFFAHLKMAAMKAFSYQEYLNFFFGENKMPYEMYQRLLFFLPEAVGTYWNHMYELFSNDGNALMNSRLLEKTSDIKNTILGNPYLYSEENYERTRSRLNEVEMEFTEKNVLEIGEGSELYDAMLFSNIESYLVSDYFSEMSEQAYIDFIENKASNQLKEGGVIQVAYQYGYKTKIKATGNFLQRLFRTKFKIQGLDYLDQKYRTVTFVGLPLLRNVEMTKDVQDCIYLYEKPKGKWM